MAAEAEQSTNVLTMGDDDPPPVDGGYPGGAGYPGDDPYSSI